MTRVERVGQCLPAVTVLIATRNGAATLGGAIEAVLRQTQTNWEMIVLDDGSEDESAAIAEGFDDRRVRCCRLKSDGFARALNFGLNAARGRFVAVLSQDGRPDARYLESHVRLLSAADRVGLVASGQPRSIGRRGRAATSYKPLVINDHLLRANVIGASATFRREAALAVSGYDPRYNTASAYDLWLRLAERHLVVWLPGPALARPTAGCALSIADAFSSLAVRVHAVWRRRDVIAALKLMGPPLCHSFARWSASWRRKHTR